MTRGTAGWRLAALVALTTLACSAELSGTDADEDNRHPDSGLPDSGQLAPIAAFAFTPASPVAGHAVNFDASASSCGAAPCTFTWTDEPPGGGVFALGAGRTLSFTFQAVGTKYVNLVVTDAAGLAARVVHEVVVANGQLLACSDSADNDGDGNVDFPADPGCSSASDTDETNALPSDATLPTIAIGAPASGATVSSVVSVAGTASDNLALSKVEVQIDSAAFATASGTANWSYSWNTASLANGSHTVTARATDIAGNTQTISVSVIVDNGSTSGNKPTESTVGPRSAATSTLPGGTYTGTYSKVHFTGAVDTSGPLTLTDCTIDGSFATFDGPVVLDHVLINGWFGITTNNQDPNKSIFRGSHLKIVGPTDDDSMRIGNNAAWGDNNYFMNTVIEDSIFYSPYIPAPLNHFDLLQFSGGQNCAFNRVVFSSKVSAFNGSQTNAVNNGVESPNVTLTDIWIEGGPFGYVLAGPMTVTNGVIERRVAYYDYTYDSRTVLINCHDELGGPLD